MDTPFKIYPRTDFQQKDGNYGIVLRLTIGRTQRKYFSLGISMPDPKKFWDSKNIQILPYPNADPVKLKENNLLLDKFSIKAKKIIFDHEITDQSLTADEFKKEFFAKGDIKTSFYDFALNDINEGKQSKKYSSETIRSYKSYLSKLKYYRSSLTFNEISIDFIKGYQSYMVNSLDNMQNTRHKSLSFIKTMLDRAVIAGIVKENVFKKNKFKLERNDGNREYLTENELNRLIQVFYNVPIMRSHYNVLKYFLFCCYSGLRYQDVRLLMHKNLTVQLHGQKEKTIVRIKMHKVPKQVEIPLPPDALDLIEHGEKNMTVFRVVSDQKTNEYLREVIKMCGIDKHITFHCSRHTYATLSLNRGMNVWTLKDLMGHRDIKTTLIYAKMMLGNKIDAVMRVWEDRL